MMRRIFSLTVLACLLLPIGLAALADDLNPPPWARLSDRTTFQQWEFLTDSSPAGTIPGLYQVPDPGWYNPYGTPVLNAWPATGSHWIPGEGVWPLSGLMEIVIPNAPDHPDWTKLIWLQLTWQPQPGATTPCLPFLLADKDTGTLIEQHSAGGAWLHSTYGFALPYNPKFETIVIGGNIWVDEVVVDTACVPEPSSLLAALVTCSTGLIGFARKRIR